MNSENFSPVFLLCSERSGSNLITRMMDSHPDICGPSPSHIIRTLALNITRFGKVSSSDSDWHSLLDIAVSIMRSQLGLWQSRWDVPALQQIVQERSVRGIVSAIYQREVELHGKKLCFIKENRAYLFLPFLLAAFPRARYVWLVRDPRDMALSWKKSPNHPGDVRQAASVWQEDQSQFRLIHGYLAFSQVLHYLRYEDLVESPERELSKLCAFLQIDYSCSMLTFHSKHETRANAERVANWQNLSKPVMTANINKFHAALLAEEICYIESKCAAEMQVHGYSPTQSPALPEVAFAALKSRLGEESLSLQDKDMSEEEARTRISRMQVIEAINALPVRIFT